MTNIHAGTRAHSMLVLRFCVGHVSPARPETERLVGQVDKTTVMRALTPGASSYYALASGLMCQLFVEIKPVGVEIRALTFYPQLLAQSTELTMWTNRGAKEIQQARRVQHRPTTSADSMLFNVMGLDGAS
eukprot:872548-Amphidinium_carterae.2